MILSSTLKIILQQEIKKHGLPTDFFLTVENEYCTIAEHLAKKYQQKNTTILININGSQGSGKSTLTAFLSLILSHHFGLNTIDVSIDDFYLKKESRTRLAKEIHPLLVTRGVPGTHDLALAVSCLQSLLNKQPCALPRFNKAIDDRLSTEQWKQVSTPVDIILFEGWCIDAPIQSKADLLQPINQLEREEDPNGQWRNYVNEHLKQYHQQLFSLSDYLIFLQIPSFDKVYEWRGLQEQKLAQTEQQNSSIMNPQQVHRFIQHYERITRHCLAVLPQKADMTVKLNEQQHIESINHLRIDLNN